MSSRAATATKQAFTIASEPISEASSTDSISEIDERQARRAQRAAEIRQLDSPYIFAAYLEYSRSVLPQLLTRAEYRVYGWLLAQTAMWHCWMVPNHHLTQAVVLRDIAEAVQLTRSTVARGVARLEDRDLVFVERLCPAGAFGGTREGAQYTILMPEACAKEYRRRQRPELAGQEKMDVEPQWLKDELEAAAGVVGMELPASSFVLQQMKREQLTQSEMVAWIREAARQTGEERDKPVAYFRRALQGMLRERGDRRLPAAASTKRARASTGGGIPKEEFDSMMAMLKAAGAE